MGTLHINLRAHRWEKRKTIMNNFINELILERAILGIGWCHKALEEPWKNVLYKIPVSFVNIFAILPNYLLPGLIKSEIIRIFFP